MLDIIEQEYVLPRPAISNPRLSATQQPIARPYRLHEAMAVPVPRLGKMLSMVRDPINGEYCGSAEISGLKEPNPMSLLRTSNRPETYATGSGTQIPFQPGGISEAAPGGTADLMPGSLCTVPDGFERGLFDVAKLQVPGLGEDIELAVERYGGDDEAISETLDQGNSSDSELDELVEVSEHSDIRAQGKAPQTARKEWAHMVDVAAGFGNFHQLVPRLARPFPFELDVFQKRAVYHLERGDSVFVAAHTSAGKTVVAEYAIALSQLHMTKTIYTSPIKALSNQKFNDFSQTFGEDNVGILTGDVKIRPEAPCLIMTTEVLKNMLYRGADVLRDVEFVVFDEVHYINDLERGVVWEEVIIMLPRHVSIILLSATVPNTREFAEWVGRTKKRDIYVISTSKRPVPLEHYLYVGRNRTGKELVRVVDKDGTFNTGQWREAYDAVNKTRPGAGRAVGRQMSERQGATLWVHLIAHLRSQGLLPAVVFTFSRKRCEEYAYSLRNLDFLNDSRRSQVHIFVERCLKRLKPEDRKLPQILAMRDLLKRGIGVHHSGLLPIVKEVVELLFARGLIFCLFATETFAMGVNMPAKCVVFSSLRKHDGRSFRELLPGEYTQMAGRAGRRGLDDTGVVVINAAHEVPDTVTLQTMILGAATRLESQFRLTYTMILSLLRAKQLRVEEVIKRSFGENAAQGRAPEHEQRLIQVKQQLDSLPPLDCAICEDDKFYQLARTIQRLTNRLHAKAAHRSLAESSSASAALQAFCPGRLVLISFFPHVALGVIIKKLTLDGSQFACMILDPPPMPGDKLSWSAPPYPVNDITSTLTRLAQSLSQRSIVNVSTTSIFVLLDAVIKQVPASVSTTQLTQTTQTSGLPATLATAIGAAIDALIQRTAIEYPWHKVRMLDFQELALERKRLLSSASELQCAACPDLADHFLSLHERALLQTELDELTMELSDQNLDLLPDYRIRLDVLKDLGYVDEMGNVQLKGRVACEMNSADELVLTELILDNTLAALEPEEIIGLLSAFVCTEKEEPEGLMEHLPPALKTARARVLEACVRVGTVQGAYGLPVSIEEYQREFRFGLMEVAYEWARGLSFINIMSLTDAQEGIIVRCIVRIADVLKNVAAAAMLIGDTELKLKLQAASELIRRDIVFAASLYF
ncbi:Antiviral helicase ski2 [Coemansia sp. RSA 1290]|nr:Antiviral helicase ski2 [Coemansia sp. RSA 1290]